MESVLRSSPVFPVHHPSLPCTRLDITGYEWPSSGRRLHNTGLNGRSAGILSAALGSSGGAEDIRYAAVIQYITYHLSSMLLPSIPLVHFCSHQLSSLVDTLRDEAFWKSQQPHYGTNAARHLLQEAQSLAAGSLPAIPGPSLQLPALQLPSVQLPSLDAFNPGVQQSVAQLLEVIFEAEACYSAWHPTCVHAFCMTALHLRIQASPHVV